MQYRLSEHMESKMRWNRHETSWEASAGFGIGTSGALWCGAGDGTWRMRAEQLLSFLIALSWLTGGWMRAPVKRMADSIHTHIGHDRGHGEGSDCWMDLVGERWSRHLWARFRLLPSRSIGQPIVGAGGLVVGTSRTLWCGTRDST